MADAFNERELFEAVKAALAQQKDALARDSLVVALRAVSAVLQAAADRSEASEETLARARVDVEAAQREHSLLTKELRATRDVVQEQLADLAPVEE